MQDVFQEMPDGGKPPRGYADLVIKASLKTHLKEYSLMERKGSLHGGPFYTFVVNIDGQAKTFKVKGQEEQGPYFDEKGKKSPEGGLGMQYAFEQKLRLKSGNHLIFFGIPGEQCYKEIHLTLEDGETYLLQFKPHYHWVRSGTAFELGVRSYSAVLNKI
jgi:hypothetical protein